MKRIFSFLLMFVFSITLFGLNVMAVETELTATYTVDSTSKVTVSGDVISGSSVTYSSTYSTKCQLTSGNSMTLTISGVKGMKFAGITLSMKSNSSGGAGTLTVNNSDSTSTVNTDLITIAEAKRFNDASWNDAWSTSYVDVVKKLGSAVILDGDTLKITISATANSLYCQRFDIHYIGEKTPQLATPSNLLVTNKVVTFDLVENSDEYDVSLYNGTKLVTKETVTSNTCSFDDVTGQGVFKVEVVARKTDNTYSTSEAAIADAWTNNVVENVSISGFLSKTVDKYENAKTQYEVTGEIKSVEENKVIITDGTNEITVFNGSYGTYTPAVGDTLTVRGVVGTYYGKVQINEATYVSHKSNYLVNFMNYTVQSSLGFSYESTYTTTEITASELTDGDQIIIANVNGTDVNYLSYDNGNNFKASTKLSEALILTVTKDAEGNISFSLPSGSKIGVKSKDSNYLNTDYTANGGELFTVNTNGALESKMYSGRTIQYNLGDSIFSTYTSSQKPITLFKVTAGTTTVNDLKLQFKVDLPKDFVQNIASPSYKAVITINGIESTKDITVKTASDGSSYLAVAISNIPVQNYSAVISVKFVLTVDGVEHSTAAKSMSVNEIVNTYVGYVGKDSDNAKIFTIGVYKSLLEIKNLEGGQA